jgi:hypothetical protein
MSTTHTSPPVHKSLADKTWAKHEHTKALISFVKANADRPFKWGTWDCALFAANGIQAMTGIDIASDFRGKYKCRKSAMAAIKDITGVANPTVADAAAYCATKHGLTELKHPLKAQRGDLVTVWDSGRLIAGLVNSNGRHVVAAGESGLNTRIPISNVERAWRV